MQAGTDSSEFRIPDSELEGSLELRVPSPQPSRLTPVPSDKILLPRRMLYVEGILYAAVAAAAFGLGYVAGRGGAALSDHRDPGSEMQGISGKVSVAPSGGAKRGDEGAVVIVLPAAKTPEQPLSIAGLRPKDWLHGAPAALVKFGAAATLTDRSGNFALSLPAAENYHLLVLSPSATAAGEEPKKKDLAELGKYFDKPAELLTGCRYQWQTGSLRSTSGSIDVTFDQDRSVTSSP